VYDKIMDKIIDRDADAVSKLDTELVEARKNDWHAQLNHAKRTQIFKIEDVLHKERETAGRYANLKFV
jgi:iron uptake system EfeUOB component EfeO/EfeM